MSKMRRDAKTARDLARQQDWSARRRAAIDVKRGVPTNPMLGIHDREPDDTDPVALLAEIPENDFARGSADLMLKGYEPDIYGPTVPREFLGRIAVAMWRRGDQPQKVRAVVQCSWDRDAPHLIAAAGRDLFRLLRFCEFPLPNDLPENVEIWRAARGVPVEVARLGMSWTFDRDAACGWVVALKVKYGVRGTPILIKRTVPRSSIVMYTHSGLQDEVVFDAPPAGDLDGTLADWMQGADRYFRLLTAHSDEGHALLEGMIPVGVFGGNPYAQV